MANAEHNEVVPVNIEKLFKVITQYESYPDFVDGVKKVKVERKGPGSARVDYEVSMMKEIEYTLEHKEDLQAGKVEWTLIESNAFKKNNGAWILKKIGENKTDVTYRLDVEFTFPVPGFILNRLVKGSLPSMVESFVNRVKETT